MGAVGFASAELWLMGNRLEPIAVRRCGFCWLHVIVVAGKYDGGLRATGVSQEPAPSPEPLFWFSAFDLPSRGEAPREHGLKSKQTHELFEDI